MFDGASFVLNADASLAVQMPAWEEAIAAIADPGRSPKYGGLRIAPQLGLVPIGRDPDSGLFEFVHLQTGVPPPRGPGGKLAIDVATGVVLILIPGGRFTIGTTSLADYPDLLQD